MGDETVRSAGVLGRRSSSPSCYFCTVKVRSERYMWWGILVLGKPRIIIQEGPSTSDSNAAGGRRFLNDIMSDEDRSAYVFLPAPSDCETAAIIDYAQQSGFQAKSKVAIENPLQTSSPLRTQKDSSAIRHSMRW